MANDDLWLWLGDKLPLPWSAPAFYRKAMAIRSLMPGQDDNEAAVAYFSRALQLAPGDEDIDQIYFNRGLTYTELGNPRAALADFDQAIRRSPRFPDFYAARGTVRQQLRQWQAALADFSRAIQLEPTADFYYRRGWLYFQRGALDTAIADFSAALTLKPQFPSLHYARGLVRELSSDRQRAIEDFQMAVNISGSSSHALLVEQGNAWMGLGELQRALQVYDQAFQANGSRLQRVDRRSNRALREIRTRLHMGRAIAHSYLGDLELARSELDIAVDLETKANHLYNRGVISWLMADRRQALQDFSEVVQRDSESAPAHYFLSILRHELGDAVGAEQEYRKALALEPFAIAFYGADGYYGRGLARSLHDDRQEALRDLTWAAQLYSFRRAETMQAQVLAKIETLSS